MRRSLRRTFFRPELRPTVWSKNKGGSQTPQADPLDMQFYNWRDQEEEKITVFRSFQKYSSQPLDRQCGKALNCKRMEKSGNIRTCSDCSDCSREDNLIVIAWTFTWKHSGDPYLKANWQRNRVTLAYISVLFKRCYVADIVEHFSHFLVGFLFRYG